MTRVLVLGAGIVGLACADELVHRGHEVRLVDPHPGSGASHAAAGMLAPGAETWWGEEALLALGRRSLALWPEYAARWGVELLTRGTLLVGRDRGDLQHVERQLALLRDGRVPGWSPGHPGEHSTGAHPLDLAGLRDAEPGLSDRLAGGALLPDECSVDPRSVIRTLLERLGDRVRPTRPDTDASEFTVVATGARLPAPYAHLVHPVRGEIARARTADPPRHTVRGWVRGRAVYVVPRGGGHDEVVIGATQEEHDDPPVPTVGGAARLLGDALELLPGLGRAELTEVIARDRPATPDHLPLVGPTGEAGVLLAAGGFRHGVLLAPLTARLVADHVETGHVEPDLDPRRFPTERRSA